MKVQTVSVNGLGVSNVLVMNTNVTPFNVGFGVVVTGSVVYTVQHSFDDPGVGFVNWFSHPTISAETNAMDGNYAFPVSAIRLIVSGGEGGTATMNVIQAGI